jgi:DEAD/DEAH box helicase domain-containing protein
LAIWIARSDPLDAYLARHPGAVVSAPLEAVVFDPDNPHVMAPHLAAAAAELPLDSSELGTLGAGAAGVLESLEAVGALRRRGDRWFWVLPERAADLTDLRGSGSGQFQLVEHPTGRVVGTVDSERVAMVAHPGAVYLHQGDHFRVRELDWEGRTALMEKTSSRYVTRPLSRSSVKVVELKAEAAGRNADWFFGIVDVTSQVTGYQRLRLPGLESIGSTSLQMPESTLRTAGMWVTIPPGTLARAGLGPEDTAAALHAAEHTGIGLLPLLATCDRWDLGGLSAPFHPDTGEATVFIHDSAPGGTGFAQRAFERREVLVAAVRDQLEACPCEDGCPACVQSPKCGNGNQSLSKAGALALVKAILED